MRTIVEEKSGWRNLNCDMNCRFVRPKITFEKGKPPQFEAWVCNHCASEYTEEQTGVGVILEWSTPE